MTTERRVALSELPVVDVRAEPDDDHLVVARVDHAGAVVAAVEDGVLAGVQFHPERSGAAGARVLENVLQWSRSA